MNFPSPPPDQADLDDALAFADLCDKHAQASEAARAVVADDPPSTVYNPATHSLGEQVERYVAALANVTEAVTRLSQATMVMISSGRLLATSAGPLRFPPPAKRVYVSRRPHTKRPEAVVAAAAAQKRHKHHYNKKDLHHRPAAPKKKPARAPSSSSTGATRKGHGGACIRCSTIHRGCVGGNRNGVTQSERVCNRCVTDGTECVYPEIKPKRRRHRPPASASLV